MRDNASKTWRPFGAWGITLNAVLGLPMLAAVVLIRPEVEIGSLTGAYASILALYAAIYGIRHWGKNTGVES